MKQIPDVLRTFAEKNRLKVTNNGNELVVAGKYGELAAFDETDFRLRLLAVPRDKVMTGALLNRRRKALTGRLELKWKADAESIFYFDPTDTVQVELVIRLVGAKRRRQLSPEQRQALADRLAKVREARQAAS